MSDSLPGATLDYDARDREIVDYRSYSLEGLPQLRLRGPAPDLKRPYFTCIGAAQTMGVYVETPFPAALATRIGVQALNLGVGAGGPGFFVDFHPKLLEWANRGRFVVLQAMSARGESSSRYLATGRAESLRNRATGEETSSMAAWARILRHEPQSAARYVAELRAAWVDRNLALIAALRVPVLLFWFSPRALDAEIDYSPSGNITAMLGFPQFVDGASVRTVAAACAGFAACYSERNTGHPLISRFTGEPVRVDHGALGGQLAAMSGTDSPIGVAVNRYYPSPEMHADAAGVLEDAIKRLGLVG